MFLYVVSPRIYTVVYISYCKRILNLLNVLLRTKKGNKL
nr:MAG TPA: hypothetical protein [Caudoviricetes sp.]